MDYEIVYKWGFSYGDNYKVNKWFIRVEALDTDWFAVAYYDLEDQDGSDTNHYYETNNDELLDILLNKTKNGLYHKCMEEKNTYLKDLEELENLDVSNFL